MTAPAPPCGTRNAYRRGCHCDACTRANAAQLAEWRAARRRRAKARKALREFQVEQDIHRVIHILATAMGEGRRP